MSKPVLLYKLGYSNPDVYEHISKYVLDYLPISEYSFWSVEKTKFTNKKKLEKELDAFLIKVEERYEKFIHNRNALSVFSMYMEFTLENSDVIKYKIEMPNEVSNNSLLFGIQGITPSMKNRYNLYTKEINNLTELNTILNTKEVTLEKSDKLMLKFIESDIYNNNDKRVYNIQQDILERNRYNSKSMPIKFNKFSIYYTHNQSRANAVIKHSTNKDFELLIVDKGILLKNTSDIKGSKYKVLAVFSKSIPAKKTIEKILTTLKDKNNNDLNKEIDSMIKYFNNILNLNSKSIKPPYIQTKENDLKLF